MNRTFQDNIQTTKLLYLSFLVTFLFLAFQGNAQIIGPYTGIDYATDYTNPDEGAPCDISFVNAAIGDADFVNGAAEVPLGWSFSGTWNSGATYYDGPGAEVLLVSLHTYTESWSVALRLSDGTVTTFLDYDLTIVTTNAIGTLASCGIIYPGPYNYERPSQELDFADYTIPPGVGVIGIVFEPYSDGAANPDPHGVIVLEDTESDPPCDDLETEISPTEFCIGGEVTLSATSTNGGVITWDGGVVDGETFIPDAPGTYTYTATSDNEDDCDFTVDVIVNDLPTVTANADDDEICNGDEVILTGGGADTYVWDAGVVDGVAFTPGATATYTVEGTDVNGCVNTAEVTVTVNELPPVDAGADVEICIGESVTLTASGAGATGTYVWDGGITDAVAFEPVTTATYTVLGTDDNGCENTDEVIVTVHPLPVIDAGADVEICIGESVTLTGAGADIGADASWDGGVLDGVAFSPESTNDYTYTVVSAEGCVNTDEVTVVVHPLPEVSFTADDVDGCTPFNVTFFSETTDEATYTWNFGDGDAGSGSTVAHTYESEGTFDVTLTVTSTEGCVDTDTYDEFIYVVDPPIADFSYFMDESIDFNTTVEFINESEGASDYLWDFGDGTADNIEVSPTHEFPTTAAGTYTVTLIATNNIGCSDRIQKTIEIKNELVYFIPNAFTPDGDDFNEAFKPIFASGLDVYDYQLVIFNRWGETIFESFNVNVGWDGTYGNGEIVQDGSYVWMIKFGETMSDKKHTINGTVTVLK
jgi:gliding motility-associated-like protein